MPDAMPDVTPDARKTRPRGAGGKGEKGKRGKGERGRGERGERGEGAAARAKGGNTARAEGTVRRKPSKAGCCREEPRGALPPPLGAPTPSDAPTPASGSGSPPYPARIQASAGRRVRRAAHRWRRVRRGSSMGASGCRRPPVSGRRRRRRRRGVREARLGRVTSADLGLGYGGVQRPHALEGKRPPGMAG